MPINILVLIVLWLLPSVAMAKDDQAFCNGKYALAQEMLDAAYGKHGTIYSGGFEGNWHGNGVGPSIDLWRLWRGLPDLRFRDARQPKGSWGQDFSDFGENDEDFAMLQRIADRKQSSGLTDVYRYVTAIFLNILVDAGSGPGWWLAPGPRDQTPRQRLVINAAKPGSLMEWLMVTMADSDTPDSVAWVLQEDRFDRRSDWAESYSYPWDIVSPKDNLRKLVTDRDKNLGGLEWKVAQLLINGSPVPGSGGWTSFDIDECKATNAEYAALAVMIFESLKREGWYGDPDLNLLILLPKEMRLIAMSNLAKQAVEKFRIHSYDGSHEAAQERLVKIAELSPSASFSEWLYVGRVWAASSADDLVAFYDGKELDWNAAKSLSLLSLDDLASFTEQVDLPKNQRLSLIKAIAARAFVLGRFDVSRRHMSMLPEFLPAEARAIESALSGPGTDEVQIARAILSLNQPTTRIEWGLVNRDSGYYSTDSEVYFNRIDLPFEFVHANVLEKDYRSWMERPFWSVGIPQWWERDRVFRRDGDYPVLHTTSPHYGLPFLRLIAWDELGQMGVCHGLTNRLSEVLIGWADESSDGWLDSLFTDKEQVAETLRRVIVLNKRSPGALVNGKPAGQASKWLLETRFPDTQAAKVTPYWYFKDQGCQN